MPEDTIVVNKSTPTPGVPNGPSADTSSGNGSHQGFSNNPIQGKTSSGNGQIVYLQDGPRDFNHHKKSKLDQKIGEIPYDAKIFIEDIHQRVLTEESSLSKVLTMFKSVGSAWSKDGVKLIYGDNEELLFPNASSLITFLDNSNRVVKQDLIQAKEGFSTKEYVPKDINGRPSSSSGVTVGIGVDLGGKTTDSLAKDGITMQFINFLKPYLGLKGDNAQNFLNSHPLNLTTTQANDLSNNYINRFSSTVANNFNAASKVKFSSIPLNTRTAIVSAAYQYGTNLAKATPHYWTQVTTGQWQAAINNLNNFGDQWPTRRKSEAELIKSDLSAGKLK
ncbi:peptidase [Salmonella enterica subsp. enterica serovar Choleraesuis]|nr:peptidase [Salmonella enterica subsp. enterica serovar Choleraesuis]